MRGAKKCFVFAVILVCLLFSGCRLSDFLPFPTFESTKYIERFQNKWCYRLLDEDMQANYGDLYTAVTDNMENDMTVTVEGDTPMTGYGMEVRLSHPPKTDADMRRLFMAFTNDNPDFFFLGHHYGLHGLQLGENTRYEKMTLLYTMDAATRKAAQEQIAAKTAAVLQKASEITDVFERELYLHDWLVSRCTYDERETDAPAMAYSAFGALVEGVAVCEGYSRAMQWLLSDSGMDCALVLGKDKNGEPHMWNLVGVDGSFYHLDATWNDSDDLPRHNYFNLTTAEISISHTIGEENFGVDVCTAREANFYRRKNLYIDTYSRREIAAVIAQRVQAGEETVELRFADGKYDNALLFIQSGNYFFETVNNKMEKGSMWNFHLYSEPDEGILLMSKM